MLFREVLTNLHRYTGQRAGAWEFLYWATDPFDNPDWESFCLDFCDVFGRFPLTTTAQAMRDPARTHAFMGV
jgi:hypothetical protein